MRQPSEITLANGRTLADVLADHRRWLLGDGGARANLSGADLSDADLSSANLSYADLSYANLSRANLSCADLSRANLSCANLSGADLSDAYLSRANLSYADLSRANLSYADLSYANLSYANLSGADLSDADLSAIADDVRQLVRGYTTPEVLGLLRALYLGRVNGTAYEGACACLVGTIANVKMCDYETLAPDSSRLAERWALAIRPGDAAPHNQIARLTAEWIEGELATRDDYVPGAFGALHVPAYSTADATEAAALAMLRRAREMRMEAE